VFTEESRAISANRRTSLRRSSRLEPSWLSCVRSALLSPFRRTALALGAAAMLALPLQLT